MSKDYLGYKGKHVVVTGAASGMGKATTEMLVDLGAKVYALDMNEILTPRIALGIKTNLADKASIDAAFALIPDTIDKYFGVAGLSGESTDYWTTVTVNFISNKYIIDTYIDSRMPSGGAIAVVTSIGGVHWEKYQREYKKLIAAETWEGMTRVLHRLAPKDGFGPFGYILSKRAMNCYIAKKARHFAEKNIRANCLMPGTTATGLTREFEKMAGGQDKLMSQSGLAKRFAEPREMAEPLIFLNSDMASYITAYHLIADCGETTLKMLKEKKDLQKMPINFGIYHTRLFKKFVEKRLQNLGWGTRVKK